MSVSHCHTQIRLRISRQWDGDLNGEDEIALSEAHLREDGSENPILVQYEKDFFVGGS